MPLSIVILAAGQGKRMHSDLPKVLQPLAGRPLLKHVIDCARSLDTAGIHIVYGHGGDQVRESLTSEPVQWALQAEQLGTGHAVLQAMPAIPDDHTVLVLYGDVPLTQAETLRALIAQANDKAIGLLSVVLENPKGYGRLLRDNAGNIYRIVEEKDATRKELAVREVNTGLMALPAAALKRWLASLRNENAQGEYYLTDIVTLAVKDGYTVSAVIAPSVAEVLGVNDKEQLAQVEAEYRRLRALDLLRQGVTLIDPLRIDIRGDVSVGRDVCIEPNVILEGKVQLGDRVRIGAGCVIRDAEIGADTVLEPYCVVHRAVVGSACNVGPFARLRPGARLGNNVHIGNYVEVKNTTLAEGAKANHLTYLGDAEVGRSVNVGAGTITCNYDGANKWPTVIEDGAFIGSGSMLVAPVTIGAGATVGAGSVITHSVPPKTLAVERNRQQVIQGWQRPAKSTPDEHKVAVERSKTPPDLKK